MFPTHFSTAGYSYGINGSLFLMQANIFAGKERRHQRIMNVYTKNQCDYEIVNSTVQFRFLSPVRNVYI